MEVYNILFNRLLSETAKRQASDLHLSVGSVPVIKKDGRLVKMEQEKIIEQEILSQIANSFLEKEEQKILEEKRELTVVKVLGGHFRFKINIYYQKGLLAASFRLIPEATRSFADLNLPAIVADFVKFSGGLVVVAGSYGGGKTTTIGAMIEHINKTGQRRILTLESAIEMPFISKQSVIEQRLIGHDVLSLVDGLKYCQKEDIDVLVVSSAQMEFIEAIPVILDIASSNSLVIVEIDTDSTIRVIEKILGCYPSDKQESARMLLADVLEGIIIQKLIPKNGGGLALALEILVGTSAVKSVIREGKVKQIETIMQTSGPQGMVTMTKSLVALVRSGQISQEDALANAPHKEDFKIMIK
ncbi:hypothetical protein COT99_03970 [Candidatus Falkowbacteria bacterium CG10_big_fil_rev_8_21_14_0_10_43_10]|uniref:Bacterial type II secretion system protein E domain-containing protein n=1 Tax=Candidatus Falkowbacteria bacterium CG10_big_fil_rev_8_21_14_0_10_43_10 TaxID=1974567 RepID=A0A2H0V183_9BACT|nr:MAG: hypothetical protein COT99_03970 [Candidatus Falkowbacteria bacterium CG10_big_fil_rev_8_21_14_0_10_43_10]